MRVALLSDCYLPRLGGIEVQVHDLAATLTARGHHVEVFTATPGTHGER
ncbi:MAG TPA: glycosyltransferase family 1 protein, partial [Lapillicoccus sp.]